VNGSPAPVYMNAGLSFLAERLARMLENCRICPRACGVNRAAGEEGFCRTAKKAYVYSYFPHHGEEPPISGDKGSGAVFFSGCNMRCVYCQNYKFSRMNAQDGNLPGRQVSAGELAEIMLALQAKGCHNINLVSPSHILPQIVQALDIASGRGLNIPLVYNTGGYDLPETIRLLEGVVDIYLADMRYASDNNAVKYSSAPGYPEFNLNAVKEMCRQRPEPVFDGAGIMRSGVIVRHLVLPQGISGTREVLKRLAGIVSPQNVCVSLMSQYFPCNNAAEFSEISRRISAQEYSKAQECLTEYGFGRGWVQQGYGLSELSGINIEERHFEDGRQ